MKSELSAFELNHIVKELQSLVSGKIEQVYQFGREEFVIPFHVPGKGKSILRIVLGKLMYIASAKSPAPEKPHGFCLYLRKRLKNSRLREVRQLGFERVIEFLLETKDAKFRLIFEMFSTGNVLLCDEDGIILGLLERQEWKDRSLKPKEKYVFPKKDTNFLDIDAEALAGMLRTSDKESLVKSLAIELGLGGVYAEELCLRAGIDKNLKPNQLSENELELLFKAIEALRSEEPAPMIVYNDENKEDVKDIVPVKLKRYKTLKSEDFTSFSEALDSVLTEKVEAKELEHAHTQAETKIDKIHEIIKQQTFRIEGLEKSEKENQRKGEVIYENYPLVQQAIEKIHELRKTMSWKEIKEHFKGHKIIKKIDEKTGELILEI